MENVVKYSGAKFRSFQQLLINLILLQCVQSPSVTIFDVYLKIIFFYFQFSVSQFTWQIWKTNKSFKSNRIMKKAYMLCLGLKKSLSSPRLELTAQGMVQHTNDQSRVRYHSATQVPLTIIDVTLFISGRQDGALWYIQNLEKPASWHQRYDSFFGKSWELYYTCFVTLTSHRLYSDKPLFFLKKWANPASFLFIFGLFKQTLQIFTANICEKMSIQYTVLGFEPATFGIWVFS